MVFTFLLLPFLLPLLYFIVRPRPVIIPIKNRHVFITGGSIGIGLAIAKRAASEGARISLLARSLDKLEEAKASICKEYDVDVSIFSADVRDYDAVQRAVKEAGPIDVLIINHGVYIHDELDVQGLDVVKFMIDVNLMGTFNVVKAALPSMKERTDRRPVSIGLMSSQAGQLGLYTHAAYASSKFALRGLAEALQQEVLNDDIHVSLICAPVTESPGLEEAMSRMPELTKVIITVGGIMKAERVARITLDGIKSGTFIIPFGFMGHVLALATSGMSPQRSFLMAAVELVFASLARLAALFYLWDLYAKIEKWRAKKKSD